MKRFAFLVVLCTYAHVAYTWNRAMENHNIYEGDMVLTPTQMKAIEEGDFGFGSKKNPTELWPGGKVPYTMSSEIANNPKAVKSINEAIAQYNKYTCIRLVPRRRHERAYINFFKGGGCSSGVGYGGGKNSISLDDGCYFKTTVMHEVAHSLGFYHEQSRPDRDNYVEILSQNINRGAEGNFKKQPYSNVDSRGQPYDYLSMMHYNWNAFGKNQKMTIKTKNIKYRYLIGQRTGFSQGDVDQINKVYQCGGGYPKVPNFVMPPAGCYDLGGGCAESKAEGRCTSSSWQTYMRKSCRHTCGFCGNGGGGPQPTIDTGGGHNCKDGVNDCHKLTIHCNSSTQAWRDYMNRVCRRSCRFCS